MRIESTLREQLWPELLQTGPFWLFFTGPALAYELAVLAGWWLQRGPADQVRYFGTWLQMFGIALVATGVRELRQELNRPTVIAAIVPRIAAIRQGVKPRHQRNAVGTANLTLRSRRHSSRARRRHC